MDSVFRVLEPVLGKINERTKAPPTFGSRFGLRAQRSDWFRVYRASYLQMYSEPHYLSLLSGFLLALGILRLDLLESEDRDSLHERVRDHGPH